MIQAAIGIDVGGTKMAGSVVDAKGKILYSHTVPPRELTRLGREFVALIAICSVLQLVNASCVGLCSVEVTGIGVAVPGSVNRERGSLLVPAICLGRISP